MMSAKLKRLVLKCASIFSLNFTLLFSLLYGCGGDTGGVGVGGTGTSSAPVSTTSVPSTNPPTPVNPGTAGGNPDPVLVAVAEPVTVTGPITGFGSVIVNGLKFDDSLAIVLRDALAVSGATLRLGMTIEVSGTKLVGAMIGTANQIRVFSELKGPSQSVSVSTNTLTVLGSVVKVDANTVFSGVADVSAIKPGDSVEAFGLRDPGSGEIVATRVEVEPATNATAPIPVALNGLLQSLNTVNKSFALNGSAVLYSSATIVGNLANGASVQVQGTTPSAGGPVNAISVTVKTSTGLAEGQLVETEGIVAEYLNRTQFKINAFMVDASSASLSPSQVARLANGARCSVHGKVSAGIVMATELECQDTSVTTNTVYEVSGSITWFKSASNFVVRNQTIDASAATINNGRLADLAVNKKVHVKGQIAGGVLKATSLEFD